MVVVSRRSLSTPCPTGRAAPLRGHSVPLGRGKQGTHYLPTASPMFHPDSSFHPNSSLYPDSKFCPSPCLRDGRRLWTSEWVREAGNLRSSGVFPGGKLLVKVVCLIIITNLGSYLTWHEPEAPELTSTSPQDRLLCATGLRQSWGGGWHV